MVTKNNPKRKAATEKTLNVRETLSELLMAQRS